MSTPNRPRSPGGPQRRTALLAAGPPSAAAASRRSCALVTNARGAAEGTRERPARRHRPGRRERRPRGRRVAMRAARQLDRGPAAPLGGPPQPPAIARARDRGGRDRAVHVIAERRVGRRRACRADVRRRHPAHGNDDPPCGRGVPAPPSARPRAARAAATRDRGRGSARLGPCRAERPQDAPSMISRSAGSLAAPSARRHPEPPAVDHEPVDLRHPGVDRQSVRGAPRGRTRSPPGARRPRPTFPPFEPSIEPRRHIVERFACNVPAARPDPVFRAASSRAARAPASPTTSRSGRIRSASRNSTSRPILPLPSRFACRASSATTWYARCGAPRHPRVARCARCRAGLAEQYAEQRHLAAYLPAPVTRIFATLGDRCPQQPPRLIEHARPGERGEREVRHPGRRGPRRALVPTSRAGSSHAPGCSTRATSTAGVALIDVRLAHGR